MRKILLIMMVLIPAILFLSGCGDDAHETHNGENEEVVYYCPMHPEVTSDKPGVCPICQMDLVLKDGDGDAMEEHLEGTVTISDNKMILANVSTVKVNRENISRRINAYSVIDFAEPGRKLVTARFGGRIEKLYVDETGTYVKRGQQLFEIYSPDLVQAQNDYLIALDNLQNQSFISSSGNRDSNPLLQSARKKLELFGITGEQIDHLEETKEVKLSLTYYSPMNGTVITKDIREGQYVNEGAVVYDIADLSVLWSISEIFENDLSAISKGDRVKLELNSYPGEVFEGRVDFIYPVVNENTRTVKVRSVLQNKGGKIKPNMYGQAIFTSDLGEGLTIPVDAVLLTGERNLVYVKTGEGSFLPREVKLGAKFDGKYQVVKGLSAGEEIAATGAYLLDSESQLRGGSVQTHQHGEEETAPAPRNEMNMPQEEDSHNHSPSVQEKPKGRNILGKEVIRPMDVKVASLDKNNDGKVYQCPMDWEVIADEPGNCPICKMKLVEYTIKDAQKNLEEYPE